MSFFGGDEPPSPPQLAPFPNLPPVPPMPGVKFKESKFNDLKFKKAKLNDLNFNDSNINDLNFNDFNINEVPAVPPPPSAQDIMDVFDELSGVSYVNTVGPNGKPARKLMRLPRTPAAQSLLATADELARQTSRNLQQLFQNNPQEVFRLNANNFIDAFSSINQDQARDLAETANWGDIEEEVANFKNIRNVMIDDEFKNLSNRMENDLAHRGLSRSTIAAEERAALAGAEAKTRMGADIESRAYGETMASGRLGRNASLFNMREQGRARQLERAQNEFELQNQGRSQALQENVSGLQTGMGIQNEDFRQGQLSQASALSHQAYGMDLQRSDLDRQRLLGQGSLNTQRILGQGDINTKRQLGQGSLNTQRILGQEDINTKRQLGQGSLNTQRILGQGDLNMRRLLGQGDLNTRRQVAQSGADYTRQLAQYQADKEQALTPYQLETNRLLAQHGGQNQVATDQYQMDLNHYNSKPPSFGDFLLNTAGTLGGAALMGPTGTVMGNLGQRAFGMGAAEPRELGKIYYN